MWCAIIRKHRYSFHNTAELCKIDSLTMHTAICRSYKMQSPSRIGFNSVSCFSKLRDGNPTSFSNFLGSGRGNKLFERRVLDVLAKARLLLFDLAAALWTWWGGRSDCPSTRVQLIWIARYSFWDVGFNQQKQHQHSTNCVEWRCLHFC